MAHPLTKKLRKNFIKRLSKLEILNAIHFGDKKSKEDVSKQLNEEVLTIGYTQTKNQLQHFMPNGEVAKLLKLCSERFDGIIEDIQNAKIGNFKNNASSFVDDWFAFDPTAYALTYELEDKDEKKSKNIGFIVVLATPTLKGVYSNEVQFDTMEDVATFLDSILIHEIAHCVGSMKHDSTFKKIFKQICELEEINPNV